MSTTPHSEEYRIEALKPEELQAGQYIFTEETLDSIIELGEVLKKIRKRMLAEGYNIVDGKLEKMKVIQF